MHALIVTQQIPLSGMSLSMTFLHCRKYLIVNDIFTLSIVSHCHYHVIELAAEATA